MTGKDRMVIAVLAIAIAVVAIAMVMSMSSDNTKDPVTPVDPDDPVDPIPEPLYPTGVSFDEEKNTLSYTEDATWYVTDELLPYESRVAEPFQGKSIELDTGLYTVRLGDDTFNVIVPGTEEKEFSWKYWYKGEYVDVSVSYSVDISELSRITLENREWNKSTHTFSYLPDIVYVNDTVRSIESQLSKRFVEIGGSLDDKQSYADFLVSFAQLGIKYPTRMGPDNSTDYEIWGVDEYWANSLETLYFGIGDCEDSAAVACSLFMAAGCKAAMVGVPGHVTAGLSLDDFVECDLEKFKSYNNLASSFKVAEGTSVADGSDTTVYYGVDTTKKQVPVGYMLKGSVDSIGKPTLLWGTAGFYPVESR